MHEKYDKYFLKCQTLIFIALFFIGLTSNDLNITRMELWNKIKFFGCKNFEEQCAFLKEHLQNLLNCPDS